MLGRLGSNLQPPVLHLSAAAETAADLSIGLVDIAHAQRSLAEAFVRTVFMRSYGARLDSFYPLLLTVSRNSGEYVAITGIRPAASRPLFSEYYLEQPVDKLLHAPRAGVVELGNLAPASAGQARWLICALSAFIIGAGYTHVVFTLVPKLRNAFRRMGLPLTWLADADPQRLSADQRADWGSYYQHHPAVYAGDIVAGTPALVALLRSRSELHQLSQLAYEAGKSFAGHGAAPSV